MKVKAKQNIIYGGYMYKRGEEFEIAAEDVERLGYAFTWLDNPPSTPADDLVVKELPPLEPAPKKAKK